MFVDHSKHENFNADSSLQMFFFQYSGNASYETRLVGVIILIQTMSIVQSQAGNMIAEMNCLHFLI